MNLPNGTHFEWHFLEQGKRNNAFLIRYEQDTQYTFTTAGSFRVCLYEILDNDTVNIYDPITISISESELSFPNAFSPNGDGINDVYILWISMQSSLTDGDKNFLNGEILMKAGMELSMESLLHKESIL